MRKESTATLKTTFLPAFNLAVLLLIVFSLIQTNASAQAFYRGASMIQVSTGFGGYYPKINLKIRAGSNYYNPKNIVKHASIRFMDPKTADSSFFKKNVLYSPFSYGVHYEYGIIEFRRKASIGIGAFLGTRTFHEREPIANSPNFYERKWQYFIGMVEVKAHKFTRDRMDPYLNVAWGVQLRRYQSFSVGYGSMAIPKSLEKEDLLSKRNSWYWVGEVSVGTRYYYSNNIALFGEVGFGMYYAKLGLNFIVHP